MTNSLLSDDVFLAAFESGTLTAFHHVDHIRAAWIYLRRLPFPEASRGMAESLRRFAARRGAHQKYHETITQAWMLLVRDALQRDGRHAAEERTPGDSSISGGAPGAACSNHTIARFDAFAAAHPELLDTHALDRFYSPQLLASPAARSQFVRPDVSPLPLPALNPPL